MGKSIATHLINKGFKDMTVYSRTKSKAGMFLFRDFVID